MAPQTRNQGNHHENENGETRGNPAPNENPKALTTLATQLVDLMKMGTNANRDVWPNGEELWWPLFLFLFWKHTKNGCSQWYDYLSLSQHTVHEK
jgi:hypothetical protein